MADETLLVALLAGLHVLGLGFAAVLLLPCLHDEKLAPGISAREDEDGGGGGGSDRLRPAPRGGPRGGGIPLPDATPARVRLRDGRRLRDLRPRVERRPAHAPTPAPTHVPARRAAASGTN